MTAMPSRWAPPDRVRCRLRWLAPAVLLALAPKCLVCLAAYAGFGAALGLGTRELCGGSGPSVAWAAWLGLSPAVFIAVRWFRRGRTGAP